MMKIGILTFHWANSFGAVLQAYTLTKLLTNMGYDAEIMNFLPSLRFVTSQVIKPHELASKYSVMGFPLVKSAYSAAGEAINYLFNLKEHSSRNHSFTNFRKFIKVSPRILNDVNELKQECQKYDVCVVGSDQVWGPHYLQYSGFAYLLPFKLEGTRKVAFSASLGVDFSYIPSSMIKLYRATLSDFSFISLRERRQIPALSSLIGREIYHTLDPTLLIGKEQLENLMSRNTPSMHDKYVLVYNLDLTALPLASKVVESLKLPAIVYSRPPLLPITRRLAFSRYFKEASSFSSCGPREFLNLMRNAEFIVTDSFHGMALSILFQKQFLTLISGLNLKTIHRILDLLELFKLNERLLSEKSFHHLSRLLHEPIDYDHIEALLAIQRRSSLKLLGATLGSAH